MQRFAEEASRAHSPDSGPVSGEGRPKHVLSDDRTKPEARILPYRPSSSQRRRTSSNASVALGKSASSSRTSGAAGPSRRNKGKAKAIPVDFETSSQIIAEDSADADSSTSGTRRGAKRRRLSPQLSLDAEEFSPTATVAEVEPDSQMTAVEEDFQMLELPDDASLPWVPMDPQSKESAFVPPGLNALIEDMKRALVFQISARQKAESMHAEELQRRRELELEAARLAAANRALEAERSAWTADAAEALATTLENALVADMSRRLAKQAPWGASIENIPEDAEMPAEDPADGVGGTSFVPETDGDEGRSHAQTQAQPRDGRPGETSTMAVTQS
ncbi:hypothetical protein OH77DRAFT_1492748 [Trametes cingulata]|nr:hypothetical protein OH77DRAFT_1492748 [Trametes cingulata]